jgi:hypothetical protein
MGDAEHMIEVFTRLLNSLCKASCIRSCAASVKDQLEVFAELLKHLMEVWSEREECFSLATEPSHLDEYGLIYDFDFIPIGGCIHQSLVYIKYYCLFL